MRFRPYPGLTAAAVILLVILCGLGSWQLERLQWKLALIENVNRNLAAPPLTLAQVQALGDEQAQYRRVTVTGRFDHAKEAYAFTTSSGGAAVYHVLTPFIVEGGTLADGRILMIDRGAVPESRRDPATRRAGNPQTVTRVTGVWRKPDGPGAFTPKPDTARRIWYTRDLAAIAAADGIHLAAPVVIDADATPNPGGWPVGGQTVVNFRNQHLSYAVTWFGLAICLLGVWLAYHIQKGRITWK